MRNYGEAESCWAARERPLFGLPPATETRRGNNGSRRLNPMASEYTSCGFAFAHPENRREESLTKLERRLTIEILAPTKEEPPCQLC